MKCRGIIAAVYHLLNCLYADGQDIPSQPAGKTDSVDHSLIFKQAKIMAANENRDTLLEAYLLFKKLEAFYPSIYPKKELRTYYRYIETANLRSIKANILGQWYFEWKGTNYLGMQETYKTKKEVIIITDSDISFYLGDSLTRRTAYSIVNEISERDKEFTFHIFFHDDRSTSRISIAHSGADYIAHLRFSTENKGLIFHSSEVLSDTAYSIYMISKASGYRME